MPGHPTSLTPEALTRAVHSVIAEVLFVPEEEVEPDRSLIVHLGAESIDFLDLVFHLEDVLGRKITAARFDRWVQARLAGRRKQDITVAMIVEFAREEAEAAGD